MDQFIKLTNQIYKWTYQFIKTLNRFNKSMDRFIMSSLYWFKCSKSLNRQSPLEANEIRFICKATCFKQKANHDKKQWKSKSCSEKIRHFHRKTLLHSWTLILKNICEQPTASLIGNMMAHEFSITSFSISQNSEVFIKIQTMSLVLNAF